MFVFLNSDITESAFDIYPKFYSSFLFIISALVAFLAYYVINVAKKPVLVCQRGYFNSFLLENCPIMHEKYFPTIWCFNSHGQTALANIFRALVPDLVYKREIVRMKDGGIVAIDWLESSNLNVTSLQPIILFLPGLAGHSQAEYIKSLVLIAQRLGCRSVVFNNRGRGGVNILTPKTYCACDTGDLREVLLSIQKQYPGIPIYAVGISLGSIILGHYLSESKENSVIAAALFISSVYDLHAGEYSLSMPGLNHLMNRHLAQKLCEIVRPYKDVFQETDIDIDHVLKSETIRDFDERFTARVFNFKNANEYYTAGTLKSKMSNIKIPLLCINAADDIFCPMNAIPCDEILRTKNLAILIPSRGGHIGFMDGTFPVLSFLSGKIQPFFSERVFEQYIRALITNKITLNNRSIFI